MPDEQYVCTVCGYNLAGYHADRCPFCGATPDRFLTAEECSRNFHVEEREVTHGVTCLQSVPDLGYEHAAYRIRTGSGTTWVDCPSCFDRRLDPTDRIVFTHHHFLGASNLYRDLFNCSVHIHRAEAAQDLCRGFTFDGLFEDPFDQEGLEAVPIDGHTPGFTVYLWGAIVFLCDYVFLEGDRMELNPYGPRTETREGARRLQGILEDREITRVCGYRSVTDYENWKDRLDRLLGP